jgi:hypothetical protein
MSKLQLLDWFLKDDKIWMLELLTQYPSLKELLSAFKDDSLKDILVYEFGYHIGTNPDEGLNDAGKELVDNILEFYKLFKPHEIYVNTFENDIEITSPVPYKNINVYYLEDNMSYIYCNNY